MRIKATSNLHRVADGLGTAAKRIPSALDQAGAQAGKIVGSAIVDPTSLHRYIPAGFEPDMDRSIRYTVEQRGGKNRTVTVIVYAGGRRNRRDIVKMNRGLLRKPVYGRTRRLKAGGRYVPPAHADRIVGDRYLNPWVGQAIRPGLVDEPFAAARPKAVDQYREAIRDVINDIGRS